MLGRRQIILIGTGLIIIVGLILLFTFGVQKPSQELSGNLLFWGVFDSPSIIGDLIGEYKKLHPKVKVNYRQLDSASYESTLINALAATNPPDLFMIHNTWVPEHYNKISPFDSKVISLSNLRDLFPQVIEQDLAPDGLIYGLPLFIDTLAMFYNRDILDQKGVATLPKTWEDFEKNISKLRTLDKLGRIEKPAAAIGGSNRSINRATDILNLVFLQAGTRMVADDFSRATFNSQEGLAAFNFYLKFANPLSPFYTWQDSFSYSLDSFAAGETAIMFNYSHQIPFLKEKNPFLNFRVASMLQPAQRSQDVNFANYWGIAVSGKTTQKTAAQDFILFLTTNPTISQKYLEATGKPPALRSLISKYSSDPEIGVFASQALTARSWPQADGSSIDGILSEMIESVLRGQLPADRAIREAEDGVTELMERRL